MDPSQGSGGRSVPLAAARVTSLTGYLATLGRKCPYRMTARKDEPGTCGEAARRPARRGEPRRRETVLAVRAGARRIARNRELAGSTFREAERDLARRRWTLARIAAAAYRLPSSEDPIRMRRPFLGLVLAVLAGLALPADAAPAADEAPAFEFALIGDPQIGYGHGGEYGDAARFERVVQGVNATPVAFSIVAGDLVEDRSSWQRWLFRRVASRLSAPARLVAGNHDVVDLASLEAFRTAHGPDYYDFVHENVAFIVLNSETARERRISAREFDEQWRFLESSLARHRAAGRRHVFLVMHRPPFVVHETEPEDHSNWPPETRARLLSLAREHGVRWILAGHLHRTHRVETADGLSIVVVPGSARSFDRSPIGFERFRIGPEGVTSESVTLGPAPRESLVVPGFREWTPRLFDFSVRHWLLTLLYGTVGFLSLRTARMVRPVRGRDEAVLWQVVAAGLFAFAANAQLDLDEFLREFGRLSARVLGAHEWRHVITGTALAVFVAVAGFQLGRLWLRSRVSLPLSVALAMLAVPAGWFCLSTISHHDLGMLVGDEWWDLASLVALATIATCSLRSAERPGSNTARRR